MTLIRTALLVIAAVLATHVGGAAADTTLVTLLAERSAEDRARDGARHPGATLAFFQVEPGMIVAEALPGSGWYTRILANYLGAEGTLYGVNYPDQLYSQFSFANPEWIAQRIAATARFPEDVAGFTDNGISARGFTFETVPEDVAGTVDRVLFIRALHNLNRFNDKIDSMDNALAATHKMLAHNGLVGVVQHRAPEGNDDAWAVGSAGYMKQSKVIALFEAAGFELLAKSEINANAADRPTEKDIVWRLPPSLRGSEDNEEMRKAMEAIGESDRMTLLFRKKAAS